MSTSTPVLDHEARTLVDNLSIACPRVTFSLDNARELLSGIVKQAQTCGWKVEDVKRRAEERRDGDLHFYRRHIRQFGLDDHVEAVLLGLCLDASRFTSPEDIAAIRKEISAP